MICKTEKELSINNYLEQKSRHKILNMATDKSLIAQKQRHEVNYVVSMLRRKNPDQEINRTTVKDVFWNTGRSRVVAYAIFRLMGYNTAKTKKANKEQEKKVAELAIKMGL
jgi:hypothetical protein